MNDSGSVDITVYQTDGKEDTDALLESNDPRINGKYSISHVSEVNSWAFNPCWL